MKQISKLRTTFLVVVLLVALFATTSFAADSSVTYEGGAEKFIFLPGSEYTDTDLFDDFKNVMPGDVLTETIQVKNSYRGCDYVKIYMKAELHDEEGNPLSEKVAAETDLVTMIDFLSQLSMTVKEGETVIYQASPDELDGLAEYVLLGSFPYGTGTELTVELHVPIELSNEYADAIGEVDWIFAVEERNNEKPVTGDGTNVGLYLGLMAIATVVLLVILVAKRKDSK